MKFIIGAIIILICAFGFYKCQKSTYDVVQHIEQRTNSNGFIDIPVNIAGTDGIVILAPVNCPSYQAKQADWLSSKLKEKNIPNRRSNSFSIRSDATDLTKEQREQLQEQVNYVINLPAPLVIVNGKVKSNPSLADVINEYEGKVDQNLSDFLGGLNKSN
ncbi:hypothetical protein MTZ49_09350 [Entomomonas sp. E2T0]|uniref:hypothetical protein n=1 Tax=Entomomonas sp. E2T0 TaxID=2930213 RepID=UPI0022285264|nr:hypothetical protein [Entomomonas sp. E2T0]UYZ82817.1 hypothetical protein MTZ49_09350 [Entomomonas sp. E2T0]